MKCFFLLGCTHSVLLLLLGVKRIDSSERGGLALELLVLFPVFLFPLSSSFSLFVFSHEQNSCFCGGWVWTNQGDFPLSLRAVFSAVKERLTTICRW